MATSKLLEAVAVTAELCGRIFSEPAARVFVMDLEGYPEPAVLAALTRCRKEVKGILTVHDVLSRIDDGRPGAEEAWSMMPFDEAQSVVWTDEMAQAFGVCGPLLAEGDKVAARMAFRETYNRLCAKAKDERLPVNWTASLGHDTRGRAAVLQEAVSLGRLPYEYAQQFCPALPAPNVLAIAGRAVQPLLPGKDAA